MLLVGKTETIKQRAIYVYLPSVEHKERWERYAKKLGVSLSKFVIEYVENSIRQEEEPGYKSRSDLLKENSELKKKVQELSKKCRLLERAVERLEEELRRYRARPFLEEEFEGIRVYEKELINLLKSREVVSSDEILSHLGIDPSESAVIKAISRQLENLEAYGLVKYTPTGWRWIG